MRRNPLARTSPAAFLLALLLAAGAPVVDAGELRLHHVPLDLPGAPAAIVTADLDGDGVLDLAVAVAYTEWNEIGITESSEIDEVEGLVEVMTVVPALLDHRELWAFRGLPDGGYEPFGPALEIGPEVLALLPGPAAMPVLALTDGGVSAVRLAGAAAPASARADGSAATGGELTTAPAAGGAAAAPPPAPERSPAEPLPAVRLDPVIAEPPVLAGSGSFLADLDLVHDLDGDGRVDLLFPAPDGLAVHLATADGALAAQPVARVALPADETERRSELTRHYPLPRVEDVTGDGLPDLLAHHHLHGWGRFWVLPGLGGGRFGAALGPLGEQQAGPDEDRRPETAFFGDLDGDGLGEHALAEELTTEDAGMRQELREAKEPPFRWRLYRSGAGLARAASPYRTFEAIGYAESGDDDGEGISLPGGFQDVDGDGRRDLVTLTLDFSLLQAVRILTVRSISIGLDFHLWCQGADGAFSRVEGLDLSGKFRLRLDDLRLGRLPQLGGDFDGDGRADFVQLGRGREVTVHLGRPGCRYPASPDVRLRLAEEPKDLGLVRVRDLDGDGRSDLAIVQPRKARSAGETAPVRLDLYFARGAAGGAGGRR